MGPRGPPGPQGPPGPPGPSFRHDKLVSPARASSTTGSTRCPRGGTLSSPTWPQIWSQPSWGCLGPGQSGVRAYGAQGVGQGPSRWFWASEGPPSSFFHSVERAGYSLSLCFPSFPGGEMGSARGQHSAGVGGPPQIAGRAGPGGQVRAPGDGRLLFPSDLHRHGGVRVQR